MSEIKKDEPAFPVMVDVERFEEDLGKYVPQLVPMGGLTKREFGAFMALQGLLSDSRTMESLAKLEEKSGVKAATLIAKSALEVTDALLKELSK